MADKIRGATGKIRRDRSRAGTVDHFDILGVSPGATDAEIREAYRSLARELHPDRHPGADSATTKRLHDAMARVNEAWSVIGDSERRAEYLSVSSLLTMEAEDDLRPPNADECMLCGSGPGDWFEFQYQNAYLLAATQYTTSLRLCRSCALSFGRSQQNRTLWTGWWGLLSFFRNFVVVWRNAQQLFRASKLDLPSAAPDVAAPLLGPLPEGAPLWKRSGIWAAVAVLVALVGVLLVNDQQSQASRNSYSSGYSSYSPTSGSGYTYTPTTRGYTFSPTTRYVPRTTAPATWKVGNCVSGYNYVSPVSCSRPNSGEIVARAYSASGCPSYTESYVEHLGVVWCIDEW